MAQDQAHTDSKSKKLSDSIDNNIHLTELQKQQSNNLPSTATFSIATPAVTTILPMTESMSDTSFMLQTTSYTQDCLILDKPYPSSTNNINDVGAYNSEDKDIKNKDTIDKDSYKTTDSTNNNSCKSTETQSNDTVISGSNLSKQLTIESDLSTQSSSSTNKQTPQQSKQQQDESNSPKMSKKRNKITKKSSKLDAKSKLEKSRQSARECRARKKLRYQYLEDLVTNREKAVVKLREELSMFCELSKQIDSGSINDNDRRLLIDQTKENNRNE